MKVAVLLLLSVVLLALMTTTLRAESLLLSCTTAKGYSLKQIKAHKPKPTSDKIGGDILLSIDKETLSARLTFIFDAKRRRGGNVQTLVGSLINIGSVPEIGPFSLTMTFNDTLGAVWLVTYFPLQGTLSLTKHVMGFTKTKAMAPTHYMLWSKCSEIRSVSARQ